MIMMATPGNTGKPMGLDPGFPRGADLLHDPRLNKGQAFTLPEREALGLKGLLPPAVFTIEEQEVQVLENFRRKTDPFEKYIYMCALQDRNETLFFRTIIDNLYEMMPIIYTPTVGKGCQLYSHILRRSRGIFITREDKGRMVEVLKNWPEKDVRVIVVTDGERILGLGDLGANGMGIPVGKLALYTSCAGIDPAHCLPVTLDVGTNREETRKDPLYIGTRQPRLTGAEFDAFVDEFMTAAQEVFPKALIQFEDFANHSAFRLLKKYQDKVCSFNDDIQGTASVILAGIYSSLRTTGGTLKDHKYLFLGAGEAGVGIGELIVSAMVDEGVSLKDARERIWLVDSKGLVVKSRTDLQDHKKVFAHDHPMLSDLKSAVETLKPTALIGVSAMPNTFTPEIIKMMGQLNKRPLIFALSNPTAKAECTAEAAYTGTEGRAIFASGSPFEPVILNGKKLVPGQGNNAYVFPGIGLGAVVCGSKRVTEEMFIVAAKALAHLVSEEDLAQACIYPPIEKIREVSAVLAAAVADVAFKRGFATIPRPENLAAFVRQQMYDPKYKSYV
jgi:malate dehydrogenase (oxaloacetate-decarboxylating)(NADP+)